jgi:hypothetical protein
MWLCKSLSVRVSGSSFEDGQKDNRRKSHSDVRKHHPRRLLMAGEEWPAQSISFHLNSNATERLDRISLRGNDKEDYELHFRFPDDNCAIGIGDLWFASDNRPEEFSVPVKFQQ